MTAQQPGRSREAPAFRPWEEFTVNLLGIGIRDDSGSKSAEKPGSSILTFNSISRGSGTSCLFMLN
jgi:hypothetical protein